MSGLTRRAFLGISASTFLACRSHPSSAIEMLIPTELPSVDPRVFDDIYAFRISRLVYSSLVALAPDTHHLEPSLAQDVRVLNAREVEVDLREDARFHDGSPVLAEDVVVTFQTLSANPKFARVLSAISVREVGPRRLHFSSDSPRATLAMDLDFPVLSARDLASASSGTPRGNGPFKVLSQRPSELLLRSIPRSTEVCVRTVHDESARALRILGGSADVVANALTPALAISLPTRSDAPRGLTETVHRSVSTSFVVIQCQHIAECDVRQALSLAIDRQAIIDAKFRGAATIARGLIPPSLQTAPTNILPLEFDPDRARSLLRKHLPKRLEIAVNSDRIRVTTARAIAQMWEHVGLEVIVHPLELGILQSRLQSGNFDVALAVAPEIADPDSLRWYVHSSAIPPVGANRSRYASPEVDRLMLEGLATIDPIRRQAIYADFEDVLRRDAPLLPLWHEAHIAVRSERARGFELTLDGRWSSLANL